LGLAIFSCPLAGVKESEQHASMNEVRTLYPLFAMFLLVSIVLLRMRLALRCGSLQRCFSSAFVLAVMWATLLVQLVRAA
jgi:hypothetical protein